MQKLLLLFFYFVYNCFVIVKRSHVAVASANVI